MAVIKGTEFCSSRKTMTGCSFVRWWLQGIVVLLLVGRGELLPEGAAATAAGGKCELARVEFRNRGLEAVLPDLQDNVTNGECLQFFPVSFRIKMYVLFREFFCIKYCNFKNFVCTFQKVGNFT